MPFGKVLIINGLRETTEVLISWILEQVGRFNIYLKIEAHKIVEGMKSFCLGPRGYGVIYRD